MKVAAPELVNAGAPNQSEAVTHHEYQFLNEWDREILSKGVSGVVLEMLDQYEQIPDVILLPETSARPLYYVFDSVFKSLAQKYGYKTPRFVFFNVSPLSSILFSLVTDTSELTDEELPSAPIVADKVVALAKKLLPHSSVVDLYHQHTSALADFQKRVIEKERADEIYEKVFAQNSNPLIVVVDDYFSGGRTRKEINLAFGVDVPYFCVFSRSDNDIGDISVGYTIPAHFPPNPANATNSRLSFGTGLGKSMIGVEKFAGTPYTKPTTTNRVLLGALRKDMRALGEEIAQSF